MNNWTPSDVVTIIAALSAFAVSVINALKNARTQAQTQGNQDQLNSLAHHIQSHDQQLTTLALSIPPGAAGAPATTSLRSGAAEMPPNSGPTDLIAPQGADAEAPQ